MSRGRFLRRSGVFLTSVPSIVAVVLGLGVIGAVLFRYVDKPWVLRIAVGPTDTGDIAFADAVQELLPRGFGHSKIEVVKTESLSASSAALDGGHAELAIVRSDVAVPRNAGTVLVAHKDAALLLGGSGSKIMSIAGLKQKRVGIVPPNQPNIDFWTRF